MTAPAEDLHLAEFGRPMVPPTRKMDGQIVERTALGAVGMEPPRLARDPLPLG